MARGENQKLKILVLAEMFERCADEENGITMTEILAELNKNGINAERKSIYSDIEELKRFGYEIEGSKLNGTYYYYLLDRKFELAELKLLVDAVQASKFITETKSNELIKKIEGLASRSQAKELQRQVYVANRIKTDNEKIYTNVDNINLAINSNKQIYFQYYEWTLNKKMELRENGEKNNISPWALMWDDENYYLVAYDSESGLIKHYRVDKIRKIKLLDANRDGKEEFQKFDMAIYAKKVFNMFTGDEVNVKLEFDNELIGVVIDRFGKDIMIIPSGPDKFIVNVNVSVSNMFLGWIIGLGNGVKILGPDRVVEKLKDEISRLNDQYK